MSSAERLEAAQPHSHRFLAEDQGANERRTWAVIALCTATMLAELVGGWMFGSIALIADGWHMSTHAGALLLAALAYGCARRYADDPRFTFGAGKFGDLAAFSSAIILALIALLIAFESLQRFVAPVAIEFGQAIPIAALGLGVNVASVWLLGGGRHDHVHDREPEHEHSDGHTHHDNNMRAALAHVMADAAVSVLVIIGLVLARAFGWLWIDPLVGVIGAAVIASWAYRLIKDAGAVLLDVNPDPGLAKKLKAVLESEGDELVDLHLWRLAPGRLGAIAALACEQPRTADYFRRRLRRFPQLAHVTIEIGAKAGEARAAQTNVAGVR